MWSRRCKPVLSEETAQIFERTELSCSRSLPLSVFYSVIDSRIGAERKRPMQMHRSASITTALVTTLIIAMTTEWCSWKSSREQNYWACQSYFCSGDTKRHVFFISSCLNTFTFDIQRKRATAHAQNAVQGSVDEYFRAPKAIVQRVYWTSRHYLAERSL